MNDDLRQTLERLRQQLSEIEHLDATERGRLQTAVTEIQASLDQQDVRSSELAKQLHVETQSFTDAHPLLTRTAGQVADILAQMGI